MFSRIYIEESVLEHHQTKQILDRFPNSERIIIEHYKDVFNRSGQDWRFQKEHQALILAERKDTFLYAGSGYTPSFGSGAFYYNAVMLNCIYDCDYCYLQGLFPSAHVVVFVNQDDFRKALVEELDKTQENMYLALSYDTDLLAFEGLFGFARPWIEFTEQEPRLSIELRTKSANISAIKGLKPNSRTVLAWSLSPQSVIDLHEKKTASLQARLKAIQTAMDAGWPIRLCIDPMLRVPNWESVYQEFLLHLSHSIDLQKVKDISVGTFRMNHAFLKRMKQQRKDTSLLFDSYVIKDGALSYHDETVSAMYDLVKSYFSDEVMAKKLDFIF
ncbi:DNA photolyase [bacterium]|nr:MAG: DNA photolyase [bacterium]